MMNLPTQDIEESSRDEPLITHALGVIWAWVELAMAGVIALVRVMAGKDQCAEPIGSPPEIVEPTDEYGELIEEADDAG